MPNKRSIVLVTPALADANNGNWQTAKRWAGMLAAHFDVQLCMRWQGPAVGGLPPMPNPDLLIALHARRSAESVLAWRQHVGQGMNSQPVLLVLTGTDLYRDIHHDATARQALAAADALVVLNELGAQELPAALRPRCHVVLQSCSARQPLAHKPTRHLRALMVGHLREEKDPACYLAAARLLAQRSDIRLDHIGAPLDADLAGEAQALAEQNACYRWLGPRPHAEVRRRIQAAHVLVHASRMEGGAHVVIEALRSGTPVLASHIAGNLGLLGSDYRATFPVGEAAALATWLQRCRDEPAILPALQAEGARRAPLFAPEAEAARLLHIVQSLLTPA